MNSTYVIPYYVAPTFISLFQKLNNYDYINKKTVYLLGHGLLAKGFLKYIDKNKFHIINISKNIKNDSLCHVDKYHNEIINNIDLDKKQITTNIRKYNFNNNYVVCGLGINTKQKEKINKIMNDKDTKKCITIVGASMFGTELSFYLSDKGHYVKLVDKLDINELYNYLSNNSKIKILSLLEKRNVELIYYKNYIDKIDDNYTILNNKPNELTEKWKIDKMLQVKNYKNIFAGGDCIDQPHNYNLPYQQGVYIAKLLNGEITEKFEYKNNGISMYCGNNFYLYETPNKIPLIIPSFLINKSIL